MNLSGLTSGITRNADKIGLLAGVASNNGITMLMDSLTQAVAGNVHMPDLALLSGTWAGGSLRTGLMAAIGGFVIEEFAPGGFKKYGKMLTDLGIGYLEGSFVRDLAYYSTHSNLGSDPAAPGYSPNWIKNVTSAPTTQQAIATYQY